MSASSKIASNSMPGPMADPQPNQSAASETQSSSKGKGIVVGLYGVSGCGKTHLLKKLKQELGQGYFAYHDGSAMIAKVVPGGLDAFQKLEDKEKVHFREKAIETIGMESADTGKVAIVAGHFMFWNETEETLSPMCTPKDLETYTHILYLDVSAEEIVQRRLDDKKRSRPAVSLSHVQKWLEAEKDQLRSVCREHGILFSLLSESPTLLDRTMALLRDFRRHNEIYNLARAERRLDEIMAASSSRLETVLVVDADRTLAAEDTGTIFWENVSRPRSSEDKDCPLKKLFKSPLGYSYTAFRQATLLYEAAADDQAFETLCRQVAGKVDMHTDFVSLLHRVAETPHVSAVVLTCGLRRVWEMVLEREGLIKTVSVIGGGRLADDFVVTGEVKATLVNRLKNVHQVYVWAFGDSPLDLDMLCKADRAIVVVGEEQNRSTTMDMELKKAADSGRLRARQVLLPSTASPRLDLERLPVIKLTDHEFIDALLRGHSRQTRIQVLSTTDTTAAKLLMTPMRNAAVAGPSLREAHRRVGWYLATKFLSKEIGLEAYTMPHVQGHEVSGYRLLHERQTLIVVLMRGGEPMALGVNDAFPRAMFFHAKDPKDIEARHLEGQKTVILVDSVVNNGDTMVKFVRHIREKVADIHIMVVAGVIQDNAISKGTLTPDAKLKIVALRLSDNKFVGTKTVDTGNRLFNSTQLP